MGQDLLNPRVYWCAMIAGAICAGANAETPTPRTGDMPKVPDELRDELRGEVLGEFGGEFRGGGVQRILRTFDFEEASKARISFPLDFVRREPAPDQGFLPFGRIGLADDAAWEGRWSLKFEVDGGSLAAGIPRGVLPIIPYADYEVRAMVRTDGLTRARAGIVAWLTNAQGEPIPGSRAQSPFVQTNGEWAPISVRVQGEGSAAEHPVDLCFELQVLQPRLLSRDGTDSSVNRTGAPENLQLNDVQGSAHFDAVTITHDPRVVMRTNQALPIFTQPQQPALEILVHDLTNEALTARLTVRNGRDEVVHTRTFSAPMLARGRETTLHTLPITDCGWYRATLAVYGESSRLRTAECDFVVLASLEENVNRAKRQRGKGSEEDVDRSTFRPFDLSPPSFGIEIPFSSSATLDHIPALAAALHADAVSLRIWDASVSRTALNERYESLRRCADALLAADRNVSFSLPRVPADLAHSAGIDSTQVLWLFSQPKSIWKPWLSDLFLDFGLRVKRWELGSLDAGMNVERSKGQMVKGEVGRPVELSSPAAAIARASPDADVRVPTYFERAGDSPTGLAEIVHVSHHLRPQVMLEEMNAWRTGDAPLTIVLQPLPEGAYSREDQVIDLAQRVLYAWRGGADEIRIEAPWQFQNESPAHSPSAAVVGAFGTEGHQKDQRGGATSGSALTIAPTPLFACWRGLTDLLSHRVFVDELALADGVHCWLLDDIAAGRKVERSNGQMVESEDVDLSTFQPFDLSRSAALVIWTDDAFTHDGTALTMQFAGKSITQLDLFGNRSSIPLIDGLHTISIGPMPTILEGIDPELARVRAKFRLEPAQVAAMHRVSEHKLIVENPWPQTITGRLQLYEVAGLVVSPRHHEFVLAPGGRIALPIHIVADRSVVAGNRQLTGELAIDGARSSTLRVTVAAPLAVEWNGVEMNATWSPVMNAEGEPNDLIVTQFITNRGVETVDILASLRAPNIGMQRRNIAGLAPGATAARSYSISGGAALLAGKTLRLIASDRAGLAQINLELTIPDKGE